MYLHGCEVAHLTLGKCSTQQWQLEAGLLAGFLLAHKQRHQQLVEQCQSPTCCSRLPALH